MANITSDSFVPSEALDNEREVSFTVGYTLICDRAVVKGQGMAKDPGMGEEEGGEQKWEKLDWRKVQKQVTEYQRGTTYRI
ncbi:hypothetical protein K2173_017238 [Erythroxylum novogranatense]|uniref:Uncharacterized protein n=1 Tax=Erythroxylum novogranatense TaxID=1862640 RepID=A0AAV8U648_9ROSI|nr:hypothetical protein K2173_017238 [Erythroxylum novogranatense]